MMNRNWGEQGMLDHLTQALLSFEPFNEQEQRDREVLLHAIAEHQEALLFRSSLCAHLTASAWVVSPDMKQVLMAYHNLYHAWSWLGGHADGDADLLHVALKEVREESGVTKVIPVSEQIYSVEVLTVDGHEKKGVYVPSHLHLNVTYLLTADPLEPVRMKTDENSGVRWFLRDEAPDASSEIWFRERIYRKLNQKLRRVPYCPEKL